MALLLAHDDVVLGAPVATCSSRDAMPLLAPASCVSVPGSVPPVVQFDRHDYAWLALCLASCDDLDVFPHPLDSFYYGTHTLTWAAMHAVVFAAITGGFSIPNPSTILVAVKAALQWSIDKRPLLRKLVAGDFELLPALVPPLSLSWWCNTPYSAWIANGMLHPLSQAMGFAGSFWDPASRDADTRFHLSLLLTHEFIRVSPSVPSMLFGDPAVRYYVTTLPPPAVVCFPLSTTRLLSVMAVRWGYMHGDQAQVLLALETLLPAMLAECPTLRRFLTPSMSGAALAAAYMIIARCVAPTFEGHRLETLEHIERKIQPYAHIADQADSSVTLLYAEARACMLKTAVEAEGTALTYAPLNETSSHGGGGGSACRLVVQALVDFHCDPVTVDLENKLLPLWGAAERRPVEVFRLVLASKSATCISILFGNLAGVKHVGKIYTILEQASLQRLNYFTAVLSIPKAGGPRPIHKYWFAYSPQVDDCLRSPDIGTFSKLNLFELGAQLRQLRRRVSFSSSRIPKPGEEFSAGHVVQHLDYLRYTKPWFEALGFNLEGPAGFSEAFQTLADFCQDGLEYQGPMVERHVGHMRRLYAKFLCDMHQAMRVFWSRPVHAYNESLDADNMFPDEGVFYGTYHRLMEETNDVSRLSSLGYLANSPLAAPSHRGSKRPMSPGSSPLLTTQGPQAKGPKPDYSAAGSFAWAVKEDSEIINVAGTRYSKAKVLAKIGLREEEICLATYLSKKGPAACPCPEKTGHCGPTAKMHNFSEELLALRPSLDEPPCRLVWSAGSPSAGGAVAGGKAAKRGGAGKAGRGGSTRK